MKFYSTNKLIIFFVVFITFLYLLPVIVVEFERNDSIIELFANQSNGFTFSLFRTFIFALLSAFINVIGGFCLALFLSKISFHSKLGKQLSFFILPITLGNIAIVFIFKVMLFDTSVFNAIIQGGNIPQTILLLFIQFWQFGFLFAYLFWLSIQKTPNHVKEYSVTIGLTRFEKIRDIILPHTKNLFMLLLLIGFIFSFYEDAKSQFILKASQGTNMELINHWLYRTYQSNLLINPTYATQSIFKTGIIVSLLLLSTFLILGFLTLVAFFLFSKIKNTKQTFYYKIKPKLQINFPLAIALLSLGIIIIPVVYVALFKSQYHYTENILSIGFPLLLTFFASLTASIFAITFGIASRLTFRNWLSDFNSKSLLYFIIIFLLQIASPIIIGLSGFRWLSWLGYSSNLVIYFVWIACHSFLLFPLLGSFITATHFGVKENELNYLIAHKISNFSTAKYSFLTRFKAEYVFTFLFAYTFIWNDSSINRVLSDYIPSFSANLQMLLIGRASDYSKATGFLWVAIALSILCVLLWQYIINKSLKTKNI